MSRRKLRREKPQAHKQRVQGDPSLQSVAAESTVGQIRDQLAEGRDFSMHVDPEALAKELGTDPDATRASPALALALSGALNPLPGDRSIKTMPMARARAAQLKATGVSAHEAVLQVISEMDEHLIHELHTRQERSEKKRKPLLVDRFLADPKYADKHGHIVETQGGKQTVIPPKYTSLIKDGLIQAKRFVLDEQAAVYLGEFIKKVPEAIAYAQEFAIPPFPITYIELPIYKLWETVNEKSADPDGDWKIGYLYRGPNVYIIFENRQGAVAMLPYFYRLNRPFKIDEEVAVCQATGFGRDKLDGFLWGRSYEQVSPECSRALRANHSFELMAFPLVRDAWQTLFYNSGGDLRNILALLLFLNQTSKTQHQQEVPMGRGMIGVKPSALLKHSVITLRMNPMPHLRKCTGQGIGAAWRREHDVRGHFCRNQDARDAETGHKCGTEDSPLHEWKEYGPNQWRCLTCTGLRWWKRAHRRGHKEKGVVQSSYEVTQ